MRVFPSYRLCTLLLAFCLAGCECSDAPPAGEDGGPGPQRDAGAQTDTGTGADTGAQSDAGPGLDTAPETDATPASDAAPQADATPAADAADAGTCADGCQIEAVCRDEGALDPDNPCQICDPARSALTWSDNDGAECEDGLFCTSGDTCLGAVCQQGSLSPCQNTEVCLEEPPTCCVPDVPSYSACNAAGDVSSYDACGAELAVVQDCPDLHGTCLGGQCGCQDGWTGPACDRCRFYVDQATGDDANGGRSWGDALETIQEAVYRSASGRCQVWIAAGTYQPTVASSLADERTRSLMLSPGVELYGGFEGVETVLGERDLDRFATVISGDIGVADYALDNTYHVVTGADGCLLDGLTIAGGYADDASQVGGGLLLTAGSMEISRCRFVDNESDGLGGAIGADSAQLSVADSTFEGNESLNGGGISCEDGTLVVERSRFVGNRGHGGAIRARECETTISSSRFDGNGDSNNCGALTLGTDTAAEVSVTIAGSVFANNRAENSGGAICIFGVAAEIANCTITLNHAESRGSGIYVFENSLVDVDNTILWNNTDPITGESNPLYVSSDAQEVNVLTSLVQGGCAALENTFCLRADSRDPRFIDAGAGDFRLRFDSPAVDHGDDSVAPATDIDGLPRFQDPNHMDGSYGYSDIGAHEYDGAAVLVRAIGYGDSLTVVFSKRITDAPAAAFSLESGVAVTGAELDSTGYRVHLTLGTPLEERTPDALTVDGVVDVHDTAAAEQSVSFEPLRAFVDESFDDNIMPSWHVVDDLGANINGPSDWAVADQVLYQRSNIYGEDGETRYGTKMLLRSGPGLWPGWKRYALSARIENRDNDGVGLVFRYHGENFYYKIDLDAQRGFARFYKVYGGVHEILAQTYDQPYTPHVPFTLTAEVLGGEFWVFIDGQSLFTRPIIDDLAIDYHGGAGGVAGLYTWGSGDDGDVVFDDVLVMGN